MDYYKLGCEYWELYKDDNIDLNKTKDFIEYEVRYSPKWIDFVRGWRESKEKFLGPYTERFWNIFNEFQTENDLEILSTKGYLKIRKKINDKWYDI